jgi:hypothetical protein
MSVRNAVSSAAFNRVASLLGDLQEEGDLAGWGYMHEGQLGRGTVRGDR